MRASIAPEWRAWARAAEPALAAALGVGITATAFYPGLMSFDSAVQFAQARGALPLDDVHPPLMALLWRACDALMPGPGGIFLLFATLWWTGLAALVWQLPGSRRARWTTALVVGLWPATFIVLAHVWKDVGMSAALLLATAAAFAWWRSGHRRWWLMSIGCLLLACGFRHNGLFAALPLLAWLCWPRPGAVSRMMPRALAGAALAMLLALAPGALVRALDATRAQPWSVVVMWDLAALSLDARHVLLPASVRTPDLTLDDLARGYVPWANPPLFATGKLHLSFEAPFSAQQQVELLRAWRDAILDHPASYLAHRARLARYLLFGFPRALPRELIYVPQRLRLPSTPVALPAVDEQAWIWRAADALRATPLFAGASYLLLALVALAVSFLRRGSGRALVGVLVASSWGNALPLLVLSGSAEFRYLAWSALAALLAFAITLLGARRDIR